MIPFTSKLYYKACCLALFFVAAAASFNGYFVKWHFREAGTSEFMPRASFDVLVDGSAARPYVYRQLLPMLATWIDGRVSERIKDRLLTAKGDRGPTFLSRLVDSPLAQDRIWFLRYLIVYALVFLFAWLSVHALFQAGKVLGYPSPPSALAAIAFILLMPYFLTVGGYLYDYPELAFCALAVWMAVKCDWWWIVPLAAMATWNKESFLLFVPTLYPFLRARYSRLRAAIGTGIIGSACVAVYAFLRMRFQHNPGGAVENHAIAQFYWFLHFFTNPFREKTYGLPVTPLFNLLCLALIVWTVWRGWRHLPQAAQRHAQIAAIINVPLYVLFCEPGELRDLSLLYVTLFLLIAANLTEWIGRHDEDNVRYFSHI